jgi:hypothetical protein
VIMNVTTNQGPCHPRPTDPKFVAWRLRERSGDLR